MPEVISVSADVARIPAKEDITFTVTTPVEAKYLAMFSENGSKVKVSFALAEAKNQNLDATVYHVTETEDGSKSAEALETSVDATSETVSAVTDGFSYYTVEFTYRELEYVLPGGETVP